MTHRPPRVERDGSVEVCVVCHRPVEREAHSLGGRVFCAVHYARVARENRASVTPIVVLIAGVLAFAGLVALLAGAVGGQLTGVPLVVAGMALAIVPAAAWLVAFYLQDRLEPEPKHFVLGTFVLGAVVAEALSRPILRDFFQVQEWLHDNRIGAILGSILVVGIVQEFLKYAVVRYTVFNSPEFDERVDGIIYGAAAGLGFATMLNFRYVLANDGVDLGVGAMAVAITALAHASYSGVTGYFLGRAKFESMGPVWLPLGLALAATLNGVTSYVIRELPLMGISGYSAWLGLIGAAVLAGTTFVVLFRTIHGINRSTVAEMGGARG